MNAAAPPEVVTINTDYSCTTECTTKIGRITAVELCFKNTTGQFPSPALTLQVIVEVDGVNHTYEQPLGTTTPHSGDHRHEHTHNQITALMQLTGVSKFSDIVDHPVLVLFGVNDPETVYGVCDFTTMLRCHTQSMTVLLRD